MTPITIKEIPLCLNKAQLEYKFLFTIFHEVNEKKTNLKQFKAIKSILKQFLNTMKICI